MADARTIALFDAAGQPWCSLDADLWIEDRNAAFVSSFGTTKQFLDIVLVEDRAATQSSLSHGPVGPLAFAHRLAGGGGFVVEWNGVRRRDGGVDLLSSVGRLAARRVAELTRTNQQLEEFAYVVTHDLDEPIRMVNRLTELLEANAANDLPPEALRYIHHAAEGGRLMQGLVRDLLGYSRVHRRGRAFRPFEMTEALAAAIEPMSALIEQTNALILDGVLPRVLGDEGQIVEALKHILHNALKFRSHASPRIEVDATPLDHMWRFTITDNGIGIDEQHLEQIFGIFKRLHPSGTYAGTGIGLPLCRRIVERHGGLMWAEPHDGGARIAFTLPGTPT